MRFNTLWLLAFSLLPSLCVARALVRPEIGPKVEARARAGSRVVLPFKSRSMAWVQTFATYDGKELNFTDFVVGKASQIILAAWHINEGGIIHLNDAPPNDTRYDYVWPQIKELQEQNIKVSILLGGAARGSYWALAKDFEKYYQQLREIIQRYSFDGIDLDVEEVVDINVILRLLRRLNFDFGPKFILTMAPVASDMFPKEYAVGLSGFSYHDLDSMAFAWNKPGGKLIDWFNVQFYNGWGVANEEWYNYICQVGGWDSKRICMGVLNNPRNGGSGWIPLSQLVQTIKNLQVTYGGNMGGGIGWEYFNAGRDPGDGPIEPREWVGAISDALYGVDNVPATVDTLRVDPNPASLPPPQSPWQNLVAALLGTGATPLEANRALNITGGDLGQALPVVQELKSVSGELVGSVLKLVESIGHL
ncbi:hypothetical protein TWF696_007280 [Orbilia brochopaga]|uniref:chitinase n=1 Tax=Orbilia brochopaga TaxID=3140254 RepID=A0AAV9URU6_9PEZI